MAGISGFILPQNRQFESVGALAKISGVLKLYIRNGRSNIVQEM